MVRVHSKFSKHMVINTEAQQGCIWHCMCVFTTLSLLSCLSLPPKVLRSVCDVRFGFGCVHRELTKLCRIIKVLNISLVPCFNLVTMVTCDVPGHDDQIKKYKQPPSPVFTGPGTTMLKQNDCLQIKVKSNEQTDSEMNQTGKVTFLPLMIYFMQDIINVCGTSSCPPLWSLSRPPLKSRSGPTVLIKITVAFVQKCSTVMNSVHVQYSITANLLEIKYICDNKTICIVQLMKYIITALSIEKETFCVWRH